MTRAEMEALIARVEAAVLASWRALMSPAEADRIGPPTMMVMAHEAAKAALRARVATMEDTHG